MTSPGTKIKYLRQISNMSQEELGRRVGVQRAAINKYEKDRVTNIPISTIEKIAKVFEVSPTYIVGWNDAHANELSAEVKVLQGVKRYYGSDVVDIMEDYLALSPEGKERLRDYLADLWKLYRI